MAIRGNALMTRMEDRRPITELPEGMAGGGENDGPISARDIGMYPRPPIPQERMPAPMGPRYAQAGGELSLPPMFKPLTDRLMALPPDQLQQAMKDMWDEHPTDMTGEILEQISKARGVPPPWEGADPSAQGAPGGPAGGDPPTPYVDPYDFNRGGTPSGGGFRNDQMQHEGEMNKLHPNRRMPGRY